MEGEGGTGDTVAPSDGVPAPLSDGGGVDEEVAWGDAEAESLPLPHALAEVLRLAIGVGEPAGVPVPVALQRGVAVSSRLCVEKADAEGLGVDVKETTAELELVSQAEVLAVAFDDADT